ncbi:MAG: pyruvate kinase alpha/beta domain-containing protein [Bacillota bacterium]|uniref:pyruvate kinase alpha/beta domain-containing protein n=1 Tax=Desulfurispora thermophila TaxID=265470 RepID=UPI00036D7C8A|nr:pyruvate kinase alpha/beta domain-containing protein [Desulfurispora thermophila]
MYFDHKGPSNTGQTIELAVKRAQELGLSHLVVASCSGETALKCVGRGLNVVCVTHHVGFAGPGVDEMGAEMRHQLKEKGVSVLTTTHLLAGVDRGVRNKFGGVYPAEIMAQTLRMLGQGLKVCLEITVMALDAGLIPYGEDVVAIGGTGSGADTAAVIRPAHASQIFESKIKEIICKPRNF